MAPVDSFAASYLTCRRWPSDVGVERFEAGQAPSRRSRMATSSWQSIPSTLKTDSAWTSQTVQVVSCIAALLHVPQALLEQADDVLVVERVVDLPPSAPRAHEAHAAQQPQLVRDGRLADPDQLGDIADAQLSAGERVENPDSRRIAQHSERVGERLNGGVGHQPLASGLRSGRVEMRCRTGLSQG